MVYGNLQQKVYFLTNTNSTSFTNADMAILATNAVERVASLVRSADGRWQYDDSNQTDLPIATTTLTASQQDYSLATSHLTIQRIEVKDENGDWKKLIPIDKVDVYDQSITDFMSGGGTPSYYDIFGSTVMLYPYPDYTQAASLKVFFERGPVSVLTTDISSTSTSPGFSSLYHDLVAYWIAYDYSIAKGVTNKLAPLMTEIQRKEEALQEDYALRNMDEHIGLRARARGRSAFI